MISLRNFFKLYLLCLLLCSVNVLCNVNYYPVPDPDLVNREIILRQEHEMRFGGDLVTKFTKEENQVNDIVKNLKRNEIDRAINDPQTSPITMHFFQAKPLIEQSEIYKLIRRMPKGALLHGHNTAMVSSEWILKNITYRAGLKVCPDDNLLLTFKNVDLRCASATPLVSLADMRANATNVTEFDDKLRKSFDIYSSEPGDVFNPTVTLKRFQRYFSTVYDAIHYIPVFKAYHYQLLQELYDDNVMYAELRGVFGPVYDDVNENCDEMTGVRIIKTVVEEFKQTHPDFIGLKLIYVCGRFSPNVVANKIDTIKKLIKEFPNFVIGFDIVGLEESGPALTEYYEKLEALALETKLFLHAGETSWYGSKTDNNLVDAILLKPHRIGHAFSLMKHPQLWRAVKRNKIPIEVNPISNQVLNLVHDLRNHPAAFYMAENLPIVISSDDPGMWRADSLSHDFYYAFMAIAPIDGGLEILKQLAYNSIMFSVLTDDERTNCNNVFERQWEEFLQSIVDSKELTIVENSCN